MASFRFGAKAQLKIVRALATDPVTVATLCSTSFPVVEYTERYSERLDGHSFSAMRFGGDVGEDSDFRTGRLRDTAVSALIKRWRHWGGRRAPFSFCLFSQTDSPYVRCFEEIRYESCLGDILDG